MMSNIEELKSMIEHLSQKIDDLKFDTKVEKKIEKLYEKLHEKSFEELYEKLYEKNIDTKVEKNIYEMKHSKLIDLLNVKFDQKIERILREPKFHIEMVIYNSTPRASTSPTSTRAASMSSSDTSTCSSRDLNKKYRF